MGELNLILLGPPGAGKGTQGERLVSDFDLPYFATGDIRLDRVAHVELAVLEDGGGDLGPAHVETDELAVHLVVAPVGPFALGRSLAPSGKDAGREMCLWHMTDRRRRQAVISGRSKGEGIRGREH